jgi:16S rRNA (uracil1498-N3)-methyltransferase
VIAVGSGVVELEIGARDYVVAPQPRLVVVQALAKGERGELAVQAMTEVGVDAIVPWSASRAVVRWDGERGERARQRWVRTAREATKQSRRAWLPEVSVALSTADVCAQLARASRALVLHEAATVLLTGVDLPRGGEIVLVVGPEGGIAAAELSAFEAVGAQSVRLGCTVLRTSTAGLAALCVLNTRLDRW